MANILRDPQASTSEQLELEPAPGLSSGIVDRLRGLPEPHKIALGVTAGLFLVSAPILILVFHQAIWRTLLALLSLIFILGMSSLILWGAVLLYTMVRAKSRKRAEETRFAQSLEQTRRFEALRAIAEGESKPITDIGPLLVRNSEVVWFRCPARIAAKRNESVDGDLYVTCLRLVFVGQGTSVEVPLGYINAVHYDTGGLHVTGKTVTASQEFAVADSELAATHIRHAVRVFHRQVDVGFEAEEGRRIPQEVKTAVWQRDGGRCIQCGATDYLEFDHVIPYSRGGANTVDNLQLLCRRCNLRKSDAI